MRNEKISKASTVYDEWTDAEFTKLRNSLGYDYANKLRERVLKPNGEKYTARHIRKALTKDHANETIVLEAIELKNELEERRKAALESLIAQ